MKRTYLSLLPPVQLVELLLAIDADRSNYNIAIFPPNIQEAIKHLQAARQAYPHMYAHPYYYTHPIPPAKSNAVSTAQSSKHPVWPTPTAMPKVKPEPEVSTSTKAQTQQAPPPQPSSSSGSNPSQLNASAQAALARAALAASENRNSDDLPSYEEMIVEAITEMNEPDGTPPKVLFAWMAARYPLQSNFRPSASQALQKAFRRGRLIKSPAGKYRMNPAWEGTVTTRRTSRRPQQHNLNFTPPQPHPHYWSQASKSTERHDNTKPELSTDDTKPSSVSLQSAAQDDTDPPIQGRSSLQSTLRLLAQQLEGLVASRQQQPSTGVS